jgi:Cys-rich repeat protein
MGVTRQHSRFLSSALALLVGGMLGLAGCGGHPGATTGDGGQDGATGDQGPPTGDVGPGQDVAGEQPAPASCTTDSDCPAGETCSSGTCVGRNVPNGGPCSGNAECQSGLCQNGMCVSTTPPPAGCTSNADCPDGTCVGGVCQGTGQKPNGSACAGNADCLSGLCDNGTCQPGGSAMCTQDSDCSIMGEVCMGGTCTGTGQVPNGSACSGNLDCMSGLCQSNVCQPGGGPPPPCTGKSCADQGSSCGLASDHCGQQINCWPDPGNPACPGAAQACIADPTTGAQTCVSGGPVCTGSLCGSVPTNCGQTSLTQLTGTVVTPGIASGGNMLNQLPVPNTLVYIPADPSVPLPTIFQGVSATDPASCGRCSDVKLVADGQSVLAQAVTDFKGQFTLSGQIPVGVAFNLVILSGKWRRVVQIPATVAQACSSAPLTLAQTRLAKNSTDGLAGTQLPKIAISTGSVDALECVFAGMGIDQAEFTPPTGTGRIHLYKGGGCNRQDNQCGGAATGTCTGTFTDTGNTFNCADTQTVTDGNGNTFNIAAFGCVQARPGCSNRNTVADTQLFGTQTALNNYNVVIGDCQGGDHRTGDNTRLEAYVNAGGRLFASHYAHTWLDGNGSLSQSSAWQTDDNQRGSATGDVSLPSGPTARTGADPVKSQLFVNWLTYQGTLNGTTAGQTTPPNKPQFTINNPRDFAGDSVGPSTDEWVYSDDDTKVQQLSFDTPYGAAPDAVCGRVAYSGFHVANGFSVTNPSSQFVFPAECSLPRALTTQERILAFNLFDLAACLGAPPQAPQCTPAVCPTTPNTVCGVQADGCGGVITCDTCQAGFVCNGSTCVPMGCQMNTDCTGGQVCMAAQCQPCTAGSQCDAGQACTNGTCGPPPPGATCTSQSDCASTQVCQNGMCTACGNTAPCADNLVCRDGSCVPPMCTMTPQCPETQSCIMGFCSPCRTSTDCTGGQVCVNGSCVTNRPRG